MNRPKDLSTFEWMKCQEFAFHFAKQSGFYNDVDSYANIKNSVTWGEAAYKEGLNLAIVTCKYWRDFYLK